MFHNYAPFILIMMMIIIIIIPMIINSVIGAQ